MLQINQIKITTSQSEDVLLQKITSILQVSESEILSYSIKKRSIDSRKKPLHYYIYSVHVEVKNEHRVLQKSIRRKQHQISQVKPSAYQLPTRIQSDHKPEVIIVGSGPAGLFCAYLLVQTGFKPIIIERGADVDQRTVDVETFWETGRLHTESNVQFGEGGAGTFSDGKLNTQVNDKSGRNQYVLETFVAHGAQASILYDQKPHVGTDVLRNVVRSLRNTIIGCGGEFHFHTKLIGIHTTESASYTIKSIQLQQTQDDGSVHVYEKEVKHLVLDIGHSARDTFRMLQEAKVPMEAKAFAVGYRIEHAQDMVNHSQYGDVSEHLPPASYKLTTRLDDGRAVYTFCMCPGGYIVNASSEEERIVVNGMSYQDRGSTNANSAVITTVSLEDLVEWGYHSHALMGMDFQQHIEENAYQVGKGKIPIQRFEDFCKQKITTTLGTVTPHTKGDWVFAPVTEILPSSLNQAIETGIKQMDLKLKGFACRDALLLGVESRTSSPVRILRDRHYQTKIRGIYPCGEGAGYAGGITSAAMDGLKVAESICHEYLPVIQ